MDVELYQRDGSLKVSDIENQDEIESDYEKSPSTPPFIANAVRMAALYHLERIRNLGLEGKNSNQASYYSALDTDPTTEKDRRARQRMVRSMLMSDINELFSRVIALEDKLITRRKKDLLSQFCLASVITSGVISGAYITPFRNILFKLGLLFFGAYITHAIYRVYTIGRSVSYTRLVREGLVRLADRVRGEGSFSNRDVECLGGEIWNRVPWGEVEDV